MSNIKLDRVNINFDKTKNGKELVITTLGDIHIARDSKKTKTAIGNLAFYLNDTLLDKTDILILEGDVFDSWCRSDSDISYKVQAWITYLLKACAKHKVRLRVLKGTHSHDWNQNRFFIEQANNAEIPVDIGYFDSIKVERIDDLNINILYIPDDIEPETALKESKAQLQIAGLDKVEFAVMHGMFEYQVGSYVGAKHKAHKEQDYLDLVKYLIYIGHIHTHSIKDRIVATGSFERLNHGEEEPKGFTVTKVTKDHANVEFIENTKTEKFLTINVTKEQAKEKVQKFVDKVDKADNVRIIYDSNNSASISQAGDIEHCLRTKGVKNIIQYTPPKPDIIKDIIDDVVDNMGPLISNAIAPVLDITTSFLDIAGTIYDGLSDNDKTVVEKYYKEIVSTAINQLKSDD